MTDSAHETARFLADSPDRTRLLAALADDPGAPRDLADVLDVSRRSVQRNLAAFEERGWVEKRDGAYHLTATGSLVAREQTRHVDALGRVDRLADLLCHLPASDLPDLSTFAEVTVTAATKENPQAPVARYVETVREFDADEVRMLSPVLSRLFHEAHASLAMRGTHTTLVLPTAAVDRARELNPTEFAVVTSVGVLDLYRHPGPVPFGVTLGDDVALLCSYDDDGQLRAVATLTDDESVEWAADVFEDYRAASEAVESPLPFR